MKKIYLSIFTALAGLSLNAQTLTDPNHSPVNGDVFSTWQCDSTAIAPGASGSGAMWNFGSIATHSAIVKNYAATTNTNASYPMPGVQVSSSATDVSYYKASATDLKYWGGNINVGTTAATLIYTTAAISATYAMNLNSTASSAIGGSITVASIPGTFTGNSATLADGTGTLVLPSGTYTSVIRVATTQTINFSLPPFATGTVTQKNWDYYSTGTKESFFTISTSTLVSSIAGTSTQTLVTRRNPAVATGINTNTADVANLSVYPNPSNTNVNFATENTDAKNVAIYDITGKLVTKQNLTDGKLTVDVSNYTTGLYMYSIIGNNNQTLKSGKITVSH